MGCNKKKKIVGLVGVMLGLLASVPLRAAVIYSDNFDGDGSTSLIGQAPDIAPGSETWLGLSLGTQWMSDGTITVANNQKRNVFLPFTPETGKKYTVKIDVVRIGSTDSFSFGFTETDAANEGFPLSGSSLNASPWMSSSGANGNVSTYLGPANGGSGSQVAVEDPDVFNTLEMMLDTREAAWTVEYRLNGNVIRSETFSSNPNINYVGFGRYNTGTFAVSDFELSEKVDPTLSLKVITSQ